MSVCMWTGPDGRSKFSNVFLILAPKSCTSCPKGGVPEAMLGHFTAAHACAKSTPAGGAAAWKLRPDIGCRFCSLDLAATWCLLTARSPAWYVSLVWFLLLKRNTLCAVGAAAQASVLILSCVDWSAHHCVGCISTSQLAAARHRESSRLLHGPQSSISPVAHTQR